MRRLTVIYVCLVFASSIEVAVASTGRNASLCVEIEHFTDCNTESHLRFYNVSNECKDGRNKLEVEATFGIPLSEDLQTTISMARCDDYKKEDECDFVFLDVETDDICPSLTDVESGTRIYRDGLLAENSECPLTGNFRFVVDGLFDQLLSYMPHDRPYILIHFRIFRKPQLEACVKVVLKLSSRAL